MSFQQKTERAAKTKATEAIKSLAQSSKCHVKQEDDANVEDIQEKKTFEELDKKVERSKESYDKEEEKRSEEFNNEEKEDDLEMLQREQLASECSRNWRFMDGMAKCMNSNCFEGIGIYETECKFCGDVMTDIWFEECSAGCVGVQGAPGICVYCESNAVTHFGG